MKMEWQMVWDTLYHKEICVDGAWALQPTVSTWWLPSRDGQAARGEYSRESGDLTSQGSRDG